VLAQWATAISAAASGSWQVRVDADRLDFRVDRTIAHNSPTASAGRSRGAKIV
jgi:hypothetical protein